jgi:hypothetical protein
MRIRKRFVSTLPCIAAIVLSAAVIGAPLSTTSAQTRDENVQTGGGQLCGFLVGAAYRHRGLSEAEAADPVLYSKRNSSRARRVFSCTLQRRLIRTTSLFSGIHR